MENLKQKLSEIETIILHAPNASYEDTIDNDLEILKQKISDLFNNVKLEHQTVVNNNLPTLIHDAEKMKYEIEKLIARFPIMTKFKDVQAAIKETDILLKICTKQVQDANKLANTLGEHNDEIKHLLDEANQLLDQINSLLPLLVLIKQSYNSAKHEVNQLNRKIAQLKELYDKTRQKFLSDQNKSVRISSKANKIKKKVLENKQLLDNIRFPTIPNDTHSNDSCDLEVPEYKSDHEQKMREQFNKTRFVQNQLNSIYRNLSEYEKKVNKAITSYEKDVENMAKIYNDYLELVDGFVKNIEEIADVMNLNEANVADTKMLQNELDNLIHKLELFLEQLEDLEKLTVVNKAFLKVRSLYIDIQTDFISLFIRNYKTK